VRNRAGGRKLLVSLTAAGAALVLTGCGAVPPGAATVVDGTTITNSQVQELADSQCAGVEQAAESQQAQTVTRRQLNQQSLRLLMDIELSLKYGKEVGLEPRPEAVAAIYAQVEQLVDSLPEKYRESTAETFHRWAEGRDLIAQAGERATGQQLTAENQQALLDAGYKQREPWLKKVDIETDARYGPNDQGFPGTDNGSVSTASSSFAKDADAAEPDPKWVGTLPANQTCG